MCAKFVRANRGTEELEIAAGVPAHAFREVLPDIGIGIVGMNSHFVKVSLSL